MTLIIDAVYENGVLKPAQPLPIKEREKVQVIINAPHDRVEQSYGIIGYTGDAESAERLALDDEFGILESP